MDKDERFKHLASDPRFKQLRKRQQKIQIDDRFKSMFSDEKFTLKYSRDKRGWNKKKTTADDLKKYYSLDKVEEKSGEKNDETEPSKEVEEHDTDEQEDERGQDESDEEDELGQLVEEEEEEEDGVEDEVSDTNSDVSSSSDESDSDDDRFVDDEVNLNKIRYDWQPLDHDAEKADKISRRLAIQNLDWDQLDVVDIFTLFNSIRPPLSVRIYLSEFGKERLAREEKEGPEEFSDMAKIDDEEEELKKLEHKMQILENKDKVGGHKLKINEYEDADEMIDTKDEELRERIRRYQLSKMKYYYAIAEFDSPESAEAVYKELDGMEYEASSLELDLRFVPDDLEFNPEDLKAECNKAPDLATYKAPQFINSALQQTTVKFTWDETDVKRQEKLRKAYTREELEKDDLEAYLASETDSDEEDDHKGEDFNDDRMSVMTGNSEARANKYKMLLKNLEEEEASKKKVDVDVVWGDYDEDEAAVGDDKHKYDQDDDDDDVDVLEEEQEEEDESEESGENEEQVYCDRVSEQDEAATELGKRKKKRKGKKGKRTRDDEIEENEDLDLLLLDVNARTTDDFKFNPDDDRFKAVYESGLYNIDPSHPNFKRTEAFNQIAERKRIKRQAKL